MSQRAGCNPRIRHALLSVVFKAPPLPFFRTLLHHRDQGRRPLRARVHRIYRALHLILSLFLSLCYQARSLKPQSAHLNAWTPSKSEGTSNMNIGVCSRRWLDIPHSKASSTHQLFEKNNLREPRESDASLSISKAVPAALRTSG